ncbi:putative ribonuclease H-like domain-containing protein [Tanacetum coccineum]
MEHYLAHIDYPIWEVIQKGNGPVSVTTDTNGVIKVLSPKTTEETLARERERKARTTLLMALPEDHLANFHKMTDAKEMWEAIKSRFGGNEESKKMQGIYSLSIDDLYNNLRVFETDIKGSTASSSSTHNVAFISSESTNSTNDVSIAYVDSTTTGNKSQKETPSSCSLLANQSSCLQLDHEDLEQLDEFDLEEMDLKWQVAMISMRLKKFHKKSGIKILFDAKEPVGFDKTNVECYNYHKIGHFARECRSKGSQIGPVTHKMSKTTMLSWLSATQDQTLREQLSDASVDIQSYTLALKKVEAQLVVHQQNQLWYKEKIRFMKINLDDKTDVLTYHKKLLAEALEEKEDLKNKFQNWKNSSKNLAKLLNTQMSANDKFGLGYGDHKFDGILSYENEVLQSVFMNKDSNTDDRTLYDRFVTADGMHAVPPPMTGNYILCGPDIKIDKSQFTYGPKQSETSESNTQTSEYNTCDLDSSNSTPKVSEPMPEPAVIEPKVISQPKVSTGAPIIEEYESDSDNDYMPNVPLRQEKPSCADNSKHKKTPRKDTNSRSQSSKRIGLGYGSTRRACFVCGSYRHLIKDCDFHEKRMAKQAELNKRVCKGTGLEGNRPVWNNVQKVNHKNQFVPIAVLTKTSKILVSTARQNFLKLTVSRKVNTARRNFVSVSPKMNENDAFKRHNVFRKSHSPAKRPFQNNTITNNMIWKLKANTSNANHVNTAGTQAMVNTIKGNKGNADDPHKALMYKGIIDSGCSRHMTRNKAYLADYKNYNGGPIAFGGSKGYITSKGKIKTGKLDFEDLPDENQVFLKVPRQNNMHSFNLENLIAKATTDESNMWHRRLGHVNFKNLNKLVKGNLVKGLPSKIFQNDHTCVACQKGKQHKASCKTKSVSSISQPLQLLHMDLFGPTSVRSINHKTYCLVITDDFSRCDNGIEFKNRDMIEFCGSKGIKREYSNARTLQQNGVTERKNRTLIEAARTMLTDLFLPNTFWAKAVSIACYVLNRVLVTKPQNKTLYELITGKLPIISYIRPFGCHVTILNTIDHLGKFEEKADEGFLVRYSLSSKAFRVYNLATKRVEENLHIKFLENKPNVAGIGPTWLFDLDYLTDSMNYQPVRLENQANKTAGPQEANTSAEVKDGDKKSHEDDVLKSKQKPVDMEEQAFLEELKRLKRQEKEAYDAAEALRKELDKSTNDLLQQAGFDKATNTNSVSTASTPVSTASTPVSTASTPVSTANAFSTGGPSADYDDS